VFLFGVSPLDGEFIPHFYIKMERTKCTVWSRVVGYLRSVDMYNEGKASEFEDRIVFKTT